MTLSRPAKLQLQQCARVSIWLAAGDCRWKPVLELRHAGLVRVEHPGDGKLSRAVVTALGRQMARGIK